MQAEQTMARSRRNRWLVGVAPSSPSRLFDSSDSDDDSASVTQDAGR